jgi:hypothetical protein
MPARVSLRVSAIQWMNRDRRSDILALLRRHRGVIGEVALFTHANMPAMPLALARSRAGQLREALAPFRGLGVPAGINVLATVGHMDEYQDGSLAEDWQHLVGHDGRVSACCYCWSDPRVLGYVRELYRAMAEAGPDFIWIDDDLRMVGYRPSVDFACFCDGCLASFTAQTGRAWTREKLLAGFDAGTREETLALRRAWLAHNREHVTGLLAAVRRAVDEVTPSLPLGYMTIDQVWAGNGYEEWTAALRGAGPAGVPSKLRPGGGFYDDQAPGGLLVKAHATGRQISFLPPEITDIQYEHENGLYQPLAKSRRIFVAEMPAAIGCGCTGIALNVMGLTPDPLDEFMPLFETTAEVKPLLDAAVDAFGVRPRAGIWRAGTRDSVAAVSPDAAWIGPAMFGYDVGPLGPLAEIGLPAAYRRDGAAVTLLSGDECLAFSREELTGLLAGSLLLDGAALERLHEMGLEELTGFRVAGRKDTDVMEVMAADPLNGRYAGWRRDCRPSFSPESTVLLSVAAAGARILSEVEDFAGQHHGVGTGCFENRLGGRVAASGYYPWRGHLSLARTSQLKALCRWLSRDTLPAYVSSYHRATVWCVRTGQGIAALVLICSLDDARNLELSVLGASVAEVRHQDGKRARVKPRRQDGPYAVFEIDRIAGWEAALIVTR